MEQVTMKIISITSWHDIHMLCKRKYSLLEDKKAVKTPMPTQKNTYITNTNLPIGKLFSTLTREHYEDIVVPCCLHTSHYNYMKDEDPFTATHTLFTTT